jgi:hypothetical protein
MSEPIPQVAQGRLKPTQNRCMLSSVTTRLP